LVPVRKALSMVPIGSPAGVRTVIDCFSLRAISVAHAKAVTAAGNPSMQIRQFRSISVGFGRD
jgi:hypothetical protein